MKSGHADIVRLDNLAAHLARYERRFGRDRGVGRTGGDDADPAASLRGLGAPFRINDGVRPGVFNKHEIRRNALRDFGGLAGRKPSRKGAAIGVSESREGLDD